MNDIYTFAPSGNISRCANVLGFARNVLRSTSAERINRNLGLHSRQVVIDDGLTHIRVVSAASGDNIIEIHSEYVPEEGGELEFRRERILHCRIELTPADDIPDYDGDPAYVALREIPISTTAIPFHFLFNVDEAKTEKIPEDTLSPETSLEDAAKIIEKYLMCKLVPAVVDENGDRISPLTPISATVPPDETNFNNLGYLDKFGAHKNNGAWVEDGNLYDLQIDEESWDPSTRAGKSNMHLMKDFYGNLPIEKYSFSMADSPPITLDSAIVYINAWATGRCNHVVEDPPGTVTFYYDNMTEPPTPSINGCPLIDKIETAIMLQTPFTFVYSDFSHMEALGGFSVSQDVHNYLVNEDSGEKIWLNTPTYAIIPYLYELKDCSIYYEREHDIQFDGAPGEPWWDNPAVSTFADFYGERAFDYMFGGAFTSYHQWRTGFPDPNAYWSKEWSRQMIYWMWETRANNDWLFMPYRAEFWTPNLVDYFEYPEYLTSIDKHVPLANAFEPGGTAVGIPNRIVMCLRSFFANTENATSLAGSRLQYDVWWDPDGNFSTRPDIFDYSHSYKLPHPSNYDDEDIYLSSERLSGKKSTYTEVPIESSPPLTTNGLPTFTTIKNDFVHVALLSSIYAETNHGEVTPDQLEISQRLGGISGSASPETSKRAFSKLLESEWEYKNVYGAGVVVSSEGKVLSKLNWLMENNYELKGLAALLNQAWTTDAFSDTGNFAEDKNSCEAEMVRAIYSTLEGLNLDKYTPICDIKLEVNLFDRYVDDNGKILIGGPSDVQ